MANAPQDLDKIRADLGRALKLIDQRAPEYQKAREYHDGTRAEIAGSSVAQAIVAQAKETPISFAHIPVDVIVDKVELASITAPEAAASAALETWYDTNDLKDESEDWVRKACFFGDYYAVTDPTGLDEDGTFTVEDIDTVGMSPLSTIVVYDKKTERVAQYGVHVWETGTEKRPETRAVMYYDDASIKLVTASGKSRDANDYTLDYPDDGEPLDAILEHDGGRMLIEHLAIGGRPYGVPLHKRAWAFQDAIAKISANNLVNVDAQGLPARWALLDPGAEIDDDIDDDFGTDGPGDPVDQTTATKAKRVRSVPGSIALLRGIKQVGTFDQGDSNGFLANLDWYVRGMAVATGIPLFEFDLTGEQPSGEARRRAEGRANRKAASVKTQASVFFRSLAETVLALVGASGTVSVTFNPSETATDKEGLELVAAKVKAGVPLRQALIEAGYTATQVAEWYPEGEAAFSIESVSAIAQALAQLGNAKTLGVINDEGVEAMLPGLFKFVSLAAEGPTLVEAPDDDGLDIVTNAGSDFKAKADALGILVRAGADPEEAATAVERGDLEGLTFPNVPAPSAPAGP